MKQTKKFMALLIAMSLMLVFTMVACSDDDDDAAGASVYTVSGTLTLPADATGKCYAVLLDTDSDGGNGVTATTQGEVSGSTVDYSFDGDCTPGSYYIYAIVDVDESSSDASCATSDVGPPNSGDYLGFYPVGYDEAPASANVTVPHSGTSFDFDLGTIGSQ